jgi:hypothetical protein
MTNSAPSPIAPEARPADRLVIHQLTDVAFDQTVERHPLFDYFRYLDELEERRFESAEREVVNRAERRANGDSVEQVTERPELPPNLVIIIGNITRPKLEDDWQRRALREGAAALRGPLESARRSLRDTVFVVPGPLDISWAARESPLGAFAEAFSPFTTPKVPSRTEPSYTLLAPDNALFAVHLFNTCPLPEELLRLPRIASKEFEDAIKAYERALGDFEKQQRRSGGRYDSALDGRLTQAVNVLLRIVAGGRILPQDREAFAKVSAESLAAGDNQRLKILVTYHPLLTEQDYMLPRQIGPTYFGATLGLAYGDGFHLAFHNQSARPQAFAGLPLMDQQVPLRHIGSASLRTMRTYNEIVATRNPKTGYWRIEMRAISLSPQSASQVKPIYPVLTPLADLITPRVSRKDEATLRRESFDIELRITSRLLAEEIESDNEEIPFTPLFRLQRAIQQVIFDGFDTLVGLAIKAVRANTGPIVLQSQYIDPEAYGDYRFTHPFTYPTTPPAWALILGRILAYPGNFGTDPNAPENVLTKDDVDWLNATDKYAPTKGLLNQYLMSVRSDRELPDDVLTRELRRAERLYETFTSQPATLYLYDTLQRPEAEGQPLPFDEVIYVPIPRRPRGEFRSARTELGTLIIEVTRRKGEDGKQLRRDEVILTEDREDMLRTVSDVMYLTLSAADKLGRPKGIWRYPRR